MTTITRRATAALTLPLLLLAACTGTAERTITDLETATGEMMPHARLPADEEAVIYRESPQLGGAAYKSGRGQPWPGDLAAKTVTFQQALPVTLEQFGLLLEKQTGLPVRVKLPPGAGVPPQSSAATSPSLDRVLAAANGGRGDGSMTSAVSSQKSVTFNETGKFVDLIERAKRLYDVDIYFDGMVINIDADVCDVFQLASDLYARTMNAAQGASGGSGGGSGGGQSYSSSGSESIGAGQGQQSANTAATVDVWKDVVTQIKQVLKGPSSRVQEAQSMGWILACGYPSEVQRIRDYVDTLNQELGVKIAVEVTVVNIDVSDNSDFGLNLNTLFNNGKYSGALAGVVPQLSSLAGTATIGLLPATAGGTSNFAGSQLAVRAAESAGRTANSQTVTAVANNGVPSPIDLTTKRRIVTGTQVSINDDSGLERENTTTERVRYGFQVQVLARRVQGDRVHISLSISNSDLTNLEERPVGKNGTVQLDTVTEQALQNGVTLKSGTTLVISGYEQLRANSNKSGVASPNFWLLGGRRQDEVRRVRTIFFVTPSIVKEAAL